MPRSQVISYGHPKVQSVELTSFMFGVFFNTLNSVIPVTSFVIEFQILFYSHCPFFKFHSACLKPRSLQFLNLFVMIVLILLGAAQL